MVLYQSEYYGICSLDMEYVEHHGIKGQRWGIRRFQNRDGSLTSRGKTRYQSDRKRGLSDSQKRALKTGAKVAAGLAITGAAAYGAYKLSDTGVLDNAASLSRAGNSGSVSDLIQRDEETGFTKITETLTDEQQRQRSNDSHEQYNCKECAFAYAMRKIRGNDVTASETPFNGNLEDFVEHYFENGFDKTLHVRGCTAENIQGRLEQNILKRFSDGDVGAISITFDRKYVRPGAPVSGHVISCERIGDSVKFIDSQGDKDGKSRADKIALWMSCVDPNRDVELVNFTKLKPKKDQLLGALKERK